MKPYRLNDPAGKNVNPPAPVASPNPGKAIIESREKTGDRLIDGSKDQAHAPQIPWPQPSQPFKDSPPASRKPFKGTK